MMSSESRGFSAIQGFLLDMDGTVYLSDQLLPGARDFLTYTARNNIPVLLLTNNSSKSRDVYVHKLAGLGLQVTPEQILSSGLATAQYIYTNTSSAKIALFGTLDLEQEFRDYGLALDMQNPDQIVLGFDTTIHYEKLTRLCNLVRDGLPYIATHPDFNCPVAGGFIPDIGAIMAFVKASTGREADVIIGKPHNHILRLASDRLGLPLRSLCMVGDRLYTDIAMGQNTPIQTALVLSGETKASDLPESPFKPDYVFADLAGLSKQLKKITHES